MSTEINSILGYILSRKNNIKKIAVDVDGTLYYDSNVKGEVPNMVLLEFIYNGYKDFEITIHSGGGKEYAETMFKQLMTRYLKAERGMKEYEAWQSVCDIFNSNLIEFRSKDLHSHVLGEGEIPTKKWEFDMFFDDEAKFYGDIMVRCRDKNWMEIAENCKEFYSDKKNHNKFPKFVWTIPSYKYCE